MKLPFTRSKRLQSREYNKVVWQLNCAEGWKASPNAYHALVSKPGDIDNGRISLYEEET